MVTTVPVGKCGEEPMLTSGVRGKHPTVVGEASSQIGGGSDVVEKMSSVGREAIALTLQGADTVVIPTEVWEDATNGFKYALVGFVFCSNPFLGRVKRFARANWGDESGVRVSQLNDGIFMLNFTSEEKMCAALLRGTWTFDNRPFILKQWAEDEEYKCGSVEALPVLIRLPEIKAHLADSRILSMLCSRIRKPICTNKVTADGSSYNYARVCVEVYAEVGLQDSIQFQDPYGNNHVLPAMKEQERRAVKLKDMIDLNDNDKGCIEETPDLICQALGQREEADNLCSMVPDTQNVTIRQGNIDDTLQKVGGDIEDQNCRDKITEKFKLHLSKSAQKRARQKEKRNSGGEENRLLKDKTDSRAATSQKEDCGRTRGKDAKMKKVEKRKKDGEWIRREKVNCVALLKVKIKEDRWESIITSCCPNSSWKGLYISAHNGWSRILLLWDDDVVKISQLTRSSHYVCCVVHAGLVSVRVSFVYASNSPWDRIFMWLDLERQSRSFTGSWICLGDFNCVLSPNEKLNGGLVRDTYMEDLKKFISACDLSDIESSGFFYTWCNKNDLPENRIWCRAKVKWLREGDANTKFYHSILKGRRARNNIKTVLCKTGVVTTDQISIKREVTEYFKSILAETKECIRIKAEVINRGKKVADSQCRGLIREATDKEIWNVLCKIGIDKSPGPDGFSASFFRKNWSLVLSGVLAERLKGILPDIIDVAHGAFIQGRLIIGNVCMAQQLLSGYIQKSISERMAWKIDLRKAYDTVD
ncbi:hypothetical protein QQ045_019579 [Rhodiola kirilowii]